MAEIRPFRGLRFDPARVNLGAVVCPPFDVISPEEQQALHDRDAHNMVRLELGFGATDPSMPDNRYARAAATLERWQREGVLVRDQAPAIYLYEHHFQHAGRPLARRGLLVAGRLHDWSEGQVLPHERTREGPKQDRLALLRATRVNTSPLWLLYDDSDHAVRTALAEAWTTPPLAVAETASERHVLRLVTDPATLRRVVEAFAARPLFIADGHHRYETAQYFRDEQRRAARARGELPDPEAGYEFALMLLVALDDPGLVILPTHRLVRGLGRSTLALRRNLERWFVLRPIDLPASETAGDEAIGRALEQALEQAPDPGEAGDGATHRFAFYDGTAAWLLWPRAGSGWEDELPPDRTAAWKALDVAVLDTLAIRGVCGIRAEAEAAGADATSHAAGDRLAYAASAAEAVRAVRRDQAEAAFLLRATRLDQLCAVALAGDRMPPKSTFLVPKPATGLVLHPLDGRRPQL